MRFSGLVQFCPLDFRYAVLESRSKAPRSSDSHWNKKSRFEAKSNLLCWVTIIMPERLLWTFCLQPRNGFSPSKKRNCYYCGLHESCTVSCFALVFAWRTPKNSQNNSWQFRAWYWTNGASYFMFLPCCLFRVMALIRHYKTRLSELTKNFLDRNTLHQLICHHHPYIRRWVTLPIHNQPSCFSIFAISERQWSNKSRTGAECTWDCKLTRGTRKPLRLHHRKSPCSRWRNRFKIRIR